MQNSIVKGRVVRNQAIRVKVLAVQPREKTDAKCAFCDKPGHAIHKCQKFTGKNVAERIKFVQINKLHFGWLKPGHRSKDYEDISVC